MNRFTVAASSTLLCGLAAASLAACSSAPRASSAPDSVANALKANIASALNATAPAEASASDAPAVSAPASDAPALGTSASQATSAAKPPTTSNDTSSPMSPKSKITASVLCVVTGHTSVPGQANVPTYSPQLTWTITNATGMALSVDDPGTVGAYGTYSAAGSLMLGNGCYLADGAHEITVVATAGARQARKTIHLQGTMTAPAPPPFGVSSAPKPAADAAATSPAALAPAITSN